MGTTQNSVRIEKRSVYQGRRKRVLWDASCGARCDCRVTENSRKAALEALTAEHKYVTESPSLERGGCSLRAVGLNRWSFTLPSGGSFVFTALDWIVAWESCVAAYGDHPDCREFFGQAARSA